MIKKNMHILFSCLSKSWGGMEMLTITQMQQLLNREMRVELLCLSDSRMLSEATKRNFKIHTLNSSGSFNLSGILKLKDILKKNNFDLIHTHASKDLWTIVPALKLSGFNIPLILTKHVGSYVIKKDFLHKWIYQRVQAAFAISEMICKNLIESTPLPPAKVMLIHNGIDVNKFDPLNADRMKFRKKFNINNDEIVIGMMGRFSPGKGHEEFIKAAQILNEKYNNLKFLIVGEASFGEADYEMKIKNLSQSIGLRNLIFTGYINDSANVLAAMDIFLFPSHAESFGLALAEAMSMELPSVSSNSEGVLDITVDNLTGFLFENKNAEDLADKTLQLISSGELRKKFGKAARQRVIENFNLQKQMDKTTEIYTSLITKINE